MGNEIITPRIPIFGTKKYQMNHRAVRAKGFRIFRATHSCGCCTTDMAFLTVENARIQFSLPRFADSVRDDMGIIHNCVNTMRGFKELVLRKKTVATPDARVSLQTSPRPAEQLSTHGSEAQVSSLL